MPDRKRKLDFKQFIAKGADPNTRLTSGETLLNEALNRGILYYGGDKELALLFFFANLPISTMLDYAEIIHCTAFSET